MTLSSMRKPVGLAAIALSAMLLVACSSGSNQQGSFQRVDSGERPDLLVALGMRAPPKPDIEYRPRSPLVLPGSTAGLQPPEENNATPQDFPVDPEIAIAAQRAENDRALVGNQQELVRRGGVMTPQEVEQWERRIGSTGRGSGRNGGNIFARVMTPNEMRDNRLASTLEPNAEPERQVLSEPPEGYRRIQPDENGNIVTPTEQEEQDRRWWQVWR